jgi:predicted deacylase
MSFNKKIIISVILLLVVIASGISAYVLFFMPSPVEVELINSYTGGDVLKNKEISQNINQSRLTNDIVAMAKQGTPVVKFGNGEGPSTLIVTGVHGDQLSPQIASLKLIDYLHGKKINGTVYIIPFDIPSSTELNQKEWNGLNPNKIADEPNNPTNDVVIFAENNGIDVVGDFHSSKPGGDPGVDTIMCTQYPTYDSYLLAEEISSTSKDFPLNYYIAGWVYDGALEDTLNLRGIPSVTGISVSNHGVVTPKAVDTTFNQMIGILKANGNL